MKNLVNGGRHKTTTSTVSLGSRPINWKPKLEERKCHEPCLSPQFNSIPYIREI